MDTATLGQVPPATIAPLDEPAAPRLRPPWIAWLLRRRTLWLLAAVVLCVGGFLGYRSVFGRAKTVYSTAAVERGDVESTVVAAGIVQPLKYVDVGAQTSGKLKSLKVQRGDQVTEGQLLAEIDPELADTALTAARATLDNMTSQRSVREAKLALAGFQRTRNETLFKELIVSADDRDITRAAYDAALADVASLSAQMKQATAAVGTAQANLSYTRITAPMAGEVVSIALLEGQTLNANQSAPNILRIADLGTVTVWAQVSEADIARVRVGQQVHFTVLGQPRRWDGAVRQILPTPELINNVVFYDVLVDIPNPDGQLKIQMTAQVFIVLGLARNVLMVPTAAIANAAEGATIKVQVLGADGKTSPRTVTIGIKSELWAEVKGGLAEKELVALRPIAEPGGSTRSALSARKGP
jgi:macrolide-specific efflux system membrane fusion protein